MIADDFEISFYEPTAITTIKLLLRRTLVRSVILIIKVTRASGFKKTYNL
jgi:hypothetical protein